MQRVLLYHEGVVHICSSTVENPDSQFFEPPDNSNQKVVPCHFTPDFSARTVRVFEPIFVSLGVSKNQDSTVTRRSGK